MHSLTVYQVKCSRKDSNLRPLAPEANALSPELLEHYPILIIPLVGKPEYQTAYLEKQEETMFQSGSRWY